MCPNYGRLLLKYGNSDKIRTTEVWQSYFQQKNSVSQKQYKIHAHFYMCRFAHEIASQ